MCSAPKSLCWWKTVLGASQKSCRLRAAGGVDRLGLLSFLDQHAAAMPRVMLRYALEHLEAKQRARYMGMKNEGKK